MSFRRVMLIAPLLIVSTLGRHVCAQNTTSDSAPVDLTVHFRDRNIDLAPYFEGFPYLRFHANYDANRLLYFRDTRTTRELWTLALDGSEVDLSRGTRLGDIDWNTRGIRSLDYDASTRSFIVQADDANEERFNLFRIPLENGQIQRITDKPYVYGFGIDKQDQTIGYIARYGTGQPYHSCLNLFDIAHTIDREVVCDSPAATFTWTEVNFRPDGSGAVVSVLRESDRNSENLAYIDLHTGSMRVLTNLAARRRNVSTLKEWIDANQFVYTSDESGFTNVFLFDLASSTSRAVTHFNEDVSDLVPLVINGQYLIAAIVKRPVESELFLVDPQTGRILSRRIFDATVTFLDHHEDRALFQSESRNTRFLLSELRVLPTTSEPTLSITPRAEVPVDVAQRMNQCTVERVSIPTFDIDPLTHAPRQLHAYLQLPRNPPAIATQRFALVESFYGGENVYDSTAQILCEAGGAVLSPSVRGSRGFGSDFAALNDHDLGGNEIVDLIYSARYLTQRLGLSEQQVGVYGASHGGYAAMRALTFPPGVNGHQDAFHWGFGISWFGFSNIVSFYEHSNIPDWVLLEAGDPRSERDRLLDRSPVMHAELATGPLLLLHGDHDRRVPVEESRRMAEAMRAAHRPVTYVEFAGQGHGLKGLSNQARVWNAVFSFLEHTLNQPQYAGAHRRHRMWKWLFIALGIAALATVLARAFRAPSHASKERDTDVSSVL